MKAGTPEIGSSDGAPGREEPPARPRDAWNPRRSLGARLVLYLVPVAVVPALVYWLAVDRETDRGEQRLLEKLLADARGHEVESLREQANNRAREIVTAMTLVRGGNGRQIAEAGVDWVFRRVFEGPGDPSRPADVELLVSEEGALLHAAPPKRLADADLRALAAVVRQKGAGDLEAELSDRRFLVVARRIPELRWIYASASPRASLEKKVRAELDPIFAAGRRRRVELRLLYLVVILVLSGALVAVTSRALTPVRRVARAADALATGRPVGEEPGLDREDEVGRLFRAMKNLERRVRWRMASMEGVHRLAQTAALMTRPDETLAQLTSQIAQLVGATKAWLCLWEPETRSLVMAPPGYGIPDEVLRGVRIGLEDQSLSMTVYRTGETVLRNDLADPRLSPEFVVRFGIRRNLVFAPLKAEVGILGVLGVADKPSGFDAEDQAAIAGYADQAALLLRNARLYGELQKSYERLRDAQRNRDYFLQNVNHELRTPLTAILGWSEVLAEDGPDKETARIAVDQIGRSAQFLLALISDLLDLSRFEEGRTRLEPEEVDLGPLVKGAVEPVSVMAEAKGIEMTIVAPEEPTPVCVDPMRMRQVLWNLVHNAVKFTPKGGRIRVEASADAAGVTFSVTDNGVGVDTKDLPFIFERFRQVDGSATRAYRGMGIGLSLAKAFVELHGGTISVESQPGKGTTFRVRLSKIASAGQAGPQTPPAA